MRNHNSSAQRQHHYGELKPMETKESRRWIAVYALAGLAFAVMLYCGMMADLPELGA